MADYSAQAVINTILSQAFPEDPIVGEEDATDLRKPNDEASQALCARVVQLADDILAQPPRPVASTSPLSSSPDSDVRGGGERAEWGLGRRWGSDALLKAIDRGNHTGGRSGRASCFLFSRSSSNLLLFMANYPTTLTLYNLNVVVRCCVVQACGHLIRSMGPKGSCAAGNTPFVSRC